MASISAVVATISPLVPSLISSTLSGRDRGCGLNLARHVKSSPSSTPGIGPWKSHLAGAERREALARRQRRTSFP